LTAVGSLRWALLVNSPRPPAASPRDQVARLPLGPGVYRFRDAAGRVLYLGRATSLRRRVASYWGDLGDRGHLAAMVDRIARVEAVPCASAHEAAWLERNLLERSKPPWNRNPSGGQEAEVWIRLSASAAAPGVRVTRRSRLDEEARYFGPYLGGQKARAAVSGLARVLPLGATTDRAAHKPTGTARELARARGAWQPARADPVLTVAAALDRDPAAVAELRTELIRRRDAAAARLAYEFAGQVQAELEALDWITAEQKVTSAQPRDFNVHGWARGVLVRFEVRNGRLSGWSQRGCAAEVGRRRLAATSCGLEWADFARRAAELAALLAP
jgi:excinuclease ABC subunit C